MTYMTIGEFAGRVRLSPKALRLYDRLGLLEPARVDGDSGYRLYTEDQIERAQLVGLLRRLGMPLAQIASVLELEAAEAARSIAAYSEQLEAAMIDRRALATYLQARLLGGSTTMFEIELRSMPQRKLLAINRRVHADGAEAFFADAFPRLRGRATGIAGIEGVPFVIYHGEVSDDSDGPIELCRPVSFETTEDAVGEMADIQLRVEPAHDEAFIRLARRDVSWPAMLPAVDALMQWTSRNERQPAGALRQVLIADWRTATPDTPACDLTIPLRGGARAA
jgi:DNA-binding transcriptional MerR regulator